MTIPRFEDSLAAALRSEAEAAMSRTDTERELDRLEDRLNRERASRLRLVATAVAASLVLLVVAGVTWGRRDTAGPPAGEDDRPIRLNLTGVTGPVHQVELRPVDGATAPTVLGGLAGLSGVARDADGTAWLLLRDSSAQRWDLLRLSADRSRVALRVPFSGAEVRGSAATDDVVVLAVADGAPTATAPPFDQRSDGLLRIDKGTGQVLGYDPVESAIDVMASDDGAIWAVVAPREVRQLDPRTGATLRTLRTPDLVDRVLALGDRLWVYYQAGVPSRAWMLDAESGRIVGTVRNPRRSIDLAVAGGVVLMEESGRLVRVEPDGSTRGATVQLPDGAVFVDVAGWDDEDIWMTTGDGLVRFDGRTLTVEGSATLPFPGPYRVARDGDGLLVVDRDAGALRRIPVTAVAGG